MDKEMMLFWAGIVLMVMTVIVCITWYNMNVTDSMKELVLQGYDPAAVRCMMEDSMGDEPTCVLQAVRGE